MVMQMKAKIKIMEKKRKTRGSSPKKKNIKSNNIQEPSALSTNGILFHEKKNNNNIIFVFYTYTYLFILTLCIVTIILDSKQSIYIGFLFLHFSYSFNFQHLFVFFFENFLFGITYIKKQRFPISFFFHFFFF